jgi:F-type H+-transporting ATPase subunit delta
VAAKTTGISERYAAALYDLADEAKRLDRVADDLRAIRQMIVESEDFALVVKSAVLSRKQQSDALLAVLEKAGADELTSRFVGVLAQNRRLDALPRIAEDYLAELARRRGETMASVVSAAPLSDSQVERITAAIAAALGGKILVDLKVDASLLGGLVVRIGSKMIDYSLKSKLARLQIAMKGTV